MKLINKLDLTYLDGYLVTEENQIVDLSALAQEFNKVVEMAELNEFITANKDDIKNSTNQVVYRPSHLDEKRPTLSTNRAIETPTIDADREQKVKLAEEYLAVEDADRIDRILAQFDHIAQWFDAEYVVYDEVRRVTPRKFREDIFAWTEEDVVQVIELYHSEEMTDLRNALVFDLS
ncbi:hypothetical protein [uncultured Halomonas sp.]|uniref:hypothetical protein n=1 Tax=uncultured Halomonas sp. TaxID=173971 RepID=UPI00260EABF5|nr:hypothetical protein [uncultured Halomonas sp.]